MSHIAFRVDSGVEMGTGHVMRCLTLAMALKEQGIKSSFICREMPGHMAEIIRDKGFLVQLLPAIVPPLQMPAETLAHGHWLVAGMTPDQQDTAAALKACVAEQGPVKGIVVDHYGIDAGWERLFRQQGYAIMVIDDLNDRQHDCDLLLDQNALKDPAAYQGLVPAACRLFVGSQYALLRPEFAHLREKSLTRRKDGAAVENILVTMGGADPYNATELVMKALVHAQQGRKPVKVVVVMGAVAPHLALVQDLAQAAALDVEVVVNTPHMAELMTQADLCIGGAGSTSWERCTLGLPTINIVLADNQVSGCAVLAQAGAVINAGRIADLTAERLAEGYIVPLLDDGAALQKLSAISASLCQGTGATIMAQQIATMLAKSN